MHSRPPHPQRSAAHGKLCCLSLLKVDIKLTVMMNCFVFFNGPSLSWHTVWTSCLQRTVLFSGWFSSDLHSYSCQCDILKEVFLLLEHNLEVPVWLWLYTLAMKRVLKSLPKLICGLSQIKWFRSKAAVFVVLNWRLSFTDSRNRWLSYAVLIAKPARERGRSSDHDMSMTEPKKNHPHSWSRVVCYHISKTFADEGIRLWQVLISAITSTRVLYQDKRFLKRALPQRLPPPPLVWASPPPPAQATAGSRRSQVAACRGKQLQMDVKGHLSISQLTSEISRHSSGRRKGKSVTRVRGSSLFSHCLPPTFYTDNDKFVLFTFPLQWTKKNWIIALGESTDTNQAHDTFFSSLSANIAQRLLLQPRIHLNRHPAEKKNNILLQSFKLFSVEFNLGNSLFWHSESSGLCCSG